MRTEWSSRALEIGSRFVVPGYVAGLAIARSIATAYVGQAQRQCQGARRRGE
jgi:hypothetical protein